MQYLVHYGVKGMKWGVRKDVVDSLKDMHYNRNDYNTNVPKTEADAKREGWVSGVANNAHQKGTEPGKRNVKYVFKDGHKEAVYNHKGELVGGSYNYGSPIHRPGSHVVLDVLPWIVWGNNPGDVSTASQRTKELLGLYGDGPVIEQVANKGRKYASQFVRA